jgi:hypothetical protein
MMDETERPENNPDSTLDQLRQLHIKLLALVPRLENEIAHQERCRRSRMFRVEGETR